MPKLNTRWASLGIMSLITIALIIWMLGGSFKHRSAESAKQNALPTSADSASTPAAASEKNLENGSSNEPKNDATSTNAADIFKVETRANFAETTSRSITVSGDTAPSQVIDLASQAEGQVEKVLARKGAHLSAGAVIAKLDARDKALYLNRADAALKQAQMEYTGSVELHKTGYVTDSELAGKFSQLQTAKANLADANFQLKHLSINAPVSGVIEEQRMEVGNYVRIGDVVSKILVTNPLIVSAHVTENDIASIKVGSPAIASIAGEKRSGKVRFVSAQADAQTRTFNVEVAISNPNSKLPAGLSAQVEFPSSSVKAHKLPASLLSLADDGTMGIKHLDANSTAIFTPVSIVKADGTAIWVSGLPDQIQLITQGQGFIKAGEHVNATTAASVTPSSTAVQVQ